MQGQKDIEQLFNLKVTQCNHILNVVHHINPTIQNIPLNKGNLFLGGVGTFKEHIINGFRITAVLSILDDMMYKRYMIRQKVQHLRIMKHKWIDIEDEQECKIAAHFDESYTFIKDSLKDHNVLVHCQMGISRSSSILIAFLMKQYRLKYQQALQLTKKKRKFISPNEGFTKELLQYQQKLFSSNLSPKKNIKSSQSIENLFDIKLPQCHHIINIQYQHNPKIEKLCQNKGNLFLGGVGTYKQPIMKGFQITAVLSILGQKRYEQCEIKQKMQRFKIKKHKWIELEDKVDEDISIHLDQTYQFIKECLKGHNVLVHCQFGRSRSASIVIAFLMREFNLKYCQALSMVVKKRNEVKPNQGFDKQLLIYENKIFS